MAAPFPQVCEHNFKCISPVFSLTDQVFLESQIKFCEFKQCLSLHPAGLKLVCLCVSQTNQRSLIYNPLVGVIYSSNIPS